MRWLIFDKPAIGLLVNQTERLTIWSHVVVKRIFTKSSYIIVDIAQVYGTYWSNNFKITVNRVSCKLTEYKSQAFIYNFFLINTHCSTLKVYITQISLFVVILICCKLFSHFRELVLYTFLCFHIYITFKFI